MKKGANSATTTTTVTDSESASNCSSESFPMSSSSTSASLHSPGSGTALSGMDEEDCGRQKHRSPPKKKYLCQDCGKEFSKLRNYRYHRTKHEGSDQFSCMCNICGKQFIDRGYLSSHMKIHRNAKEYKCGYCQKGFNQRVAYNMHLQIHTGFKPHHCETCGKSFSRRMQLKQHLRTHSGERPYLCNVCTKAFADRSNMLLHQKSHSGDRPFVCSICFKGFSRNPDLKIHMNYHFGIRPFQCSKCHARFSQSSNMNTHWKKCSGVPKSTLSPLTPGVSTTPQHTPASSENTLLDLSDGLDLLPSQDTVQYVTPTACESLPDIDPPLFDFCLTSPSASSLDISGNKCININAPQARNMSDDWPELDDFTQSQPLSIFCPVEFTESSTLSSSAEDDLIASVLRSPSPMIKFLSTLLKDCDTDSSLPMNSQPLTTLQPLVPQLNLLQFNAMAHKVAYNQPMAMPLPYTAGNRICAISSPYLHQQTQSHAAFQFFGDLTVPSCLQSSQSTTAMPLQFQLSNTESLPPQQFDLQQLTS